MKDLKKSSAAFYKLDGEETTDRQHPVRIILGADDYERIRSAEQPIIGEILDTDPGAEITVLGRAQYGKIVWIESSEEGLFPKSQSELENVCSVDVRGLAEKLETDTEFTRTLLSTCVRRRRGFIKLIYRGDQIIQR